MVAIFNVKMSTYGSKYRYDSVNRKMEDIRADEGVTVFSSEPFMNFNNNFNSCRRKRTYLHCTSHIQSVVTAVNDSM